MLGGLALNALLGWWWADPIAGIAMVPIFAKEGVDGLRGESACCDTCAVPERHAFEPIVDSEARRTAAPQGN